MKLLRVLAVVVVLLLAIVIAIPFFIDANQFRPRLEAELSGVLGRRVTVGGLNLSLWRGSVSAGDVAVADDPAFGTAPFLQAKSVDIGVELIPLIFSKKVNVTAITVDHPGVSLLQAPSGDWNYATLGRKAAAASPAGGAPAAPASQGAAAPINLSVKLVRISAGRFSMGKTGRRAQPLLLDNVNFELKDFSAATLMPFTFSADVSGGGKIELEGQAGPLHLENLELTPFRATLKATHLDLLQSGAIEASTGVAGIATVDGSFGSDGQKVTLSGRVAADQLRLVKGGSPAKRPVALDFALNHTLATRQGAVVQCDVHIGAAVAKVTGTYRPHGDSFEAAANLTANSMPVGDLMNLLPALDVVLPSGTSLEGGTASAKMTVEGPVDDLRSAGSVGLSNVTLTGFDLGGKMATIETLAGMKHSPNTRIETLSANVRNSKEGTAVDDLKFVAPDIGELTGSGTISPAKALDFKMRASVKSELLTAMTAGLSHSGIPFTVHGTASDPKVEPDVKGMARQELNGLKGGAGKAAGEMLQGILGRKK